ncbi:helix-turn-helix domain-containing protein [Streptomyces tremellae]|uniref:PucR C-terminal helix-turn-helix domain-containing protein n=1 Tax=Streptomyces tremellae TaxID=1124239 RepID=A0ABP7DQE2_9ACTN
MADEGPRAASARAEDVLALLHLVGGARGAGPALEWLARRTGGTAAVVADDGSVAASAPGRPSRAALAAVRELRLRGAPSGVAGTGKGRTAQVVALGPGESLVVEGSADDRHGPLLADAARVLEMALRSQEYARDRRRMEAARARGREAVLHLLVGGDVALAHRVSGAMGDRLPGPLRVCVVEAPAAERGAAAARLERVAAGAAWIVPCPVRSRHLIALVPARIAGWERDALAELPECRIGTSAEVALRDTALGYEQAFHALTAARGAPGRGGRFSSHDTLVPPLGPAGVRWAARVLGPCLAYTPARRSDPDAAELLDTLASWLTFGTGADRHLKIHRNTLTARVRLLEQLLETELLTGVAGRATVWLALRLRTPAAAPGPGGEPGLSALLAAPAAQSWAHARTRPLGASGLDAVRAWLRAGTRLAEAAAALGISPPGLRKRLVRAEDALGRSLLHAPSATHELWLAFRALGEL